MLCSLFFVLLFGLANGGIDKPVIPSIKVGVLGVPLDRGNPRPGAEDAPKHIRGSGFIEELKGVGHDMKDFGDLNLGFKPRSKFDSSPRAEGTARNAKEVSDACKKVAETAKKILDEDRFLLTLGGDHALTIGTVNALTDKYPNLAILYVDAHADINTITTSSSGNLHGMPLSFAMEALKDEKKPPEFSWVVPRIPANNLAYIALRSVDPGEDEKFEKLGIRAYGTIDVQRIGLIPLLRKILKHISPGGANPVLISFDIDAISDNEIHSNTGTPVPFGLTLREAMTMVEEVRDTVPFVSFELTEVNLKLGDKSGNNRTIEASKMLIFCALHHCRGGLSRRFS